MDGGRCRVCRMVVKDGTVVVCVDVCVVSRRGRDARSSTVSWARRGV